VPPHGLQLCIFACAACRAESVPGAWREAEDVRRVQTHQRPTQTLELGSDD